MVRLTTIVTVMVLLLAGAMFWASTLPESRAAGPNLVLIVLDTVRYDRTSLARSDRDTTPYLKQLAARGVSFSRAHSPAEWTVPAHASLFSGRHPSEHLATFEHRYLADEVTTVAERLQRIEYRTGAFSSNVNVSRAFHFDQGFDEFFEAYSDPRVRKGECSRSEAIEPALRSWLGLRRDAPSFVFINLMEAHLPYEAAPEHLAAFGTGASLDVGVIGAGDFLDAVVAGERSLDASFLSALADRYDAALRTLDASLERIMSVLEQQRVLDDAIVIITSDHGEHLGEKGLVDHHGALSEALLHVPLVVFGRGIPAGIVRSEPVGTEIVGERLDALAIGGTQPAQWAARRPLIAERFPAIDIAQRLAKQRPRADRSRFETAERTAISSDGRFKLSRSENGGDRLFRLGSTAVEETEIPLSDEPLVVAALHQALMQFLTDRDVVTERFLPEPARPDLGEPTHAELSQLGYGASLPGKGVSIHAQIHLERGNRALERNEAVAALAEYEGAIRLDPKFAPAYFNRALAIGQSGAAVREQRAAWEKYVDIATRHTPEDTASLSAAYAKLAALPE